MVLAVPMHLRYLWEMIKLTILEQAVKFYTMETGNEWYSFFDKIDEAMSMIEPEGDLWLVSRLVNTLVANGFDVAAIKAQKAEVRVFFESNVGHTTFNKQLGVWAKEGVKYINKYIPNSGTYNVWCIDCTDSTLSSTLRTENKLFVATMQPSELYDEKALEGTIAFSCDFLNRLDYDVVNTEFLDILPVELKQIIQNDEPLIIYVNPPFRWSNVKHTELGRYLRSMGMSAYSNNVVFQYMWRIMHFVDMFNLSRCYLGIFTPTSIFTDKDSIGFVEEFGHCFTLLDGMYISANDFGADSDVAFTLWRARGGYISESNNVSVVLDKKVVILGKIETEHRVLCEPTREPLYEWCMPADESFFVKMPVMQTHSKFKGEDIGVKRASASGKIAREALGTLSKAGLYAVENDKTSILSTPAVTDYIAITKENFWRCVAHYAVRRLYVPQWAKKQVLCRPKEETKGYRKWLYNALVLFFFDYKSLMSSVRGVEWGGDLIDINNKLFYLSPEQVKANCTDTVILADLEKHGITDTFIMNCIEEARPYWVKDCKALFDWCVQYTLDSYAQRAEYNYERNLDCWNMGFQQLRAAIWDNKTEQTYKGLLHRARDYLSKDIEKFGFIQGIEEESK